MLHDWLGFKLWIGIKAVSYTHLDVYKRQGLTRASGYNLAATTTRNGHHIVTVVLGGNTWKARDARVEQLIETAYNQIGVGKTQMAYQDAYEEQYYNSRDNACLLYTSRCV